MKNLKKAILVVCVLCSGMLSFAQLAPADERSGSGFKTVSPLPEPPLPRVVGRPVLFDPVSVSFSVYLSTRPKKPYRMQMSNTLTVMMESLRGNSLPAVMQLPWWNRQALISRPIYGWLPPIHLTTPMRASAFGDALVRSW